MICGNAYEATLAISHHTTKQTAPQPGAVCFLPYLSLMPRGVKLVQQLLHRRK